MTNNPFEILEQRLNNIELILIELQNKPEQVEKLTDRPVNIKKASEFTGLAVPTIYGKVHRKEIPFIKKDGRLYFSLKQLDEWLKSGINIEKIH